MKKIVALLMAMMMLFGMTAMAATASPVPSPDAGTVVPSPDAPGTVVPSPVPSPEGPSYWVPVAKKAEPVSLGQVLFAAHGDKCFAVITVAMQNGKIAAALIEEFQFMDAATAIGVPNSDKSFGTSFPEGKVLASKRVNNELYSANMTKAGSTVALVDNYAAIEKFVTGLTVADLEALLADMTAEAAVDAVSGATLVDTLGYLQGILAAAKAAQ